MTIFNKVKAPTGWMFPFAKKEIRALISESGATFNSVEFKNTTKPSEYLKDTIDCWFGVLSSERVNGTYQFSLELSSLQDEYVLEWKEKILSHVYPEIVKWIKWKTNQPSNSTEKPRQYFLKYKIKNRTLTSSCFEVD